MKQKGREICFELAAGSGEQVLTFAAHGSDLTSLHHSKSLSSAIGAYL